MSTCHCIGLVQDIRFFSPIKSYGSSPEMKNSISICYLHNHYKFFCNFIGVICKNQDVIKEIGAWWYSLEKIPKNQLNYYNITFKFKICM